MANKMLIDATHPEETRVVVLRGNRVEEFDFETAHRKQLRGNIYLAKVTRVEPSLQAAFVDYGGNRHGFLAFSEIHPDYYQIPVADRQALIAEEQRANRDDEDDDDGRRRRGRHRHREARRHEPREDAVHGDAPTAEEPAHEIADVPSDEHALGESLAEPQPEAPHHDTSAPPPLPEAAPAHDIAPPHEAVPIGETANPPVRAETAAPNPVDAEPPHDVADQGPAHPEPISELAPATHEVFPDQPGQPINENTYAASESDTTPAHADAEPTNGHPADEEDEVVESVGGADAMEEMPVRAPRYRRQYKIQEVIKRRQVMLVQVVKEERGTKGAALTTYLSLAGRYCVLMPNTARGGGISRKITSAEDRRKLREIADELEVPEGMGVILRTAGAARTKPEVKRDFEYLLRMWETVRDLTLKSSAPTLVYEEGSLAKRSIRDLYTKDIDEIVVAGEGGYQDAKEFMRMLMPSHSRNVKLYRDTSPIFSRYGIESQLDAMFSPTVQLRSGGYIVINQAEALVAIDVNSGRSTREHHIEDTALKTNVEAAEEVARQLRLRDLAGLIVIDFIDMDEKRNNRTVERRLKDALRNDRARIQVGRISHFGLMEMSRQRIRTSVLESSTEKCPHCGGTGHVRSVSSVALQLLRSLEDTLLKGATHNQNVRTRPEIALYVLNQKRAHLRALEERFRISITINADAEIASSVGFAIERGEQVMTPEQARAVAQEYEAHPPQLFVEEEPEPAEGEPTEDADAPPEERSAEAQQIAHDEPRDDAFAHDSAEAAPRRHDGEYGEQNGGEPGARRRRRRRRGRGGRNGEGRDQGQFQQRHDQPPDRAPDEADAPHATAAYEQPPHEEFQNPEFARGPASPGEPRHDDPQGNGDHRRRRRGRRGGRRNRRDRDDRPHFDHQGTEQPRTYEGRNETFDNNETAPQTAFPPEPPQPSYAPQPEPDVMQDAPPALQATAATPAEPAPPPRRRSTVREPAPSFGLASEPVALPTPPSPPPQPMPAAETAPTDDVAKPRRTGWWARRLLGGDQS